MLLLRDQLRARQQGQESKYAGEGEGPEYEAAWSMGRIAESTTSMR